MKVVDHDRIKKCPTCDSAALVRDRLAQGFIRQSYSTTG